MHNANSAICLGGGLRGGGRLDFPCSISSVVDGSVNLFPERDDGVFAPVELKHRPSRCVFVIAATQLEGDRGQGPLRRKFKNEGQVSWPNDVYIESKGFRRPWRAQELYRR